MKKTRNVTALLGAMVLLFSFLSGCGGSEDEPAVVPASEDAITEGESVEATTMWLVKTQGDVAVTDRDGGPVSLLARLGLFDGYGVDTQTASYGWIDLDDTKLTKMDQESSVSLKKDGGNLEMTVDRGSVFFHVTEPLGPDETLTIRTSTMVTGIRGTCGWVTVTDPEHMDVYILEGTVECSAGGESIPVSAGQRAALTTAGGPSVSLEPFTEEDVPEFVSEDVREDQTLCDAILTASGLDILRGSPAQRTMEQYRDILSQAGSYDFGGGAPTGNYRYALVTMDPADTAPTLLLEQETDGGAMYALRAFRYDPDTDTLLQPTGTLTEGTELTGGTRSTISQAGDGQGLCVTEVSAGTGQMMVLRAAITDGSLQRWGVWVGPMDQDTGIATIPIDWHDIGDASGLEGWTGQVPAAEPPAGPGPETALPQDGDRLVLSGTLDEYTYDEVVAMAPGYPGFDDERQMHPTYWLFVLDEPQTIAISSGGSPDLNSGEATLIWIGDPTGLEPYAGQHVICSFDPARTFWPSDVSLPLNEPRTSDIHILS